jgi:hypothetical protein
LQRPAQWPTPESFESAIARIQRTPHRPPQRRQDRSIAPSSHSAQAGLKRPSDQRAPQLAHRAT